MERVSGRLSVFREYDIRGRFPEELTPAFGVRLGKAIARRYPGPVFLGRDTRRESEAFLRALGGGLASAGAVARSLGTVPTPFVGFVARRHRAFAFQVTPSHNPVGYTGLKGFGPDGSPFAAEWDRLRRALARTPGLASPRRVGRAPKGARVRFTRASLASTIREYLDDRTRGLRTSERVVLDPRGGATAHLAARAFERLGADVRSVHGRFSPTFFGLSPEPRPSDLDELGRRVRESGGALGVTFDGDGDRVLFVDGRGLPIEPEAVGLLLHRRFSPARRPLVATVDMSRRLDSLASVVRARVGGRYILAAMRRAHAEVGAESSAHFYLGGYGPSSDGILVALLVADLHARSPREFDRAIADVGPIVRTTLNRRYSSDARADVAFSRARRAVQGRTRWVLDCLDVDVAEGRCLLRRSRTEPVVRAALEARTSADLKRLVHRVEPWLPAAES
jgi:phosphoglucosamine mutase